MFLGQGILLRPLLERAFRDQDSLSFDYTSDKGGASISANSQDLKRKLISVAESSTSEGASEPPTDERAKRPRTEHESGPKACLPACSSSLPPHDVLKSLVDLYFLRLHPWIPVLHVRSFREDMMDPSKTARLTCIFHAIVSVCARFSVEPYFRECNDLKALCTTCRHTVIIQSMETATVENLQALVIVAFDIVSGLGSMASVY